ncbi:MAG: CPBP family intramembrane metalloprotease [Ktedonobacteraceae bacterium]
MDTEVTGTNTSPPESITSKVNWTSIAIYLVLTFGITWTIWIGLRAIGVAFLLRVSIGMFGPAIAALLVRLVRREGFSEAGLRLVGRGHRGGGWMYLAAYLVPPLLIAASIGFVLLTGVQHWAFSENLHAAGQAIVNVLYSEGKGLPNGHTPDELALYNVIISTILAFSLFIPFNMIFTFGEEFGWRGYLLPRLAPLGGIPAAIVTGVFWGLWHAPVIVQDGYNYPGYPWLGIGVMVVFTLALSMIFTWLRFRSGSIWPTVMAHAIFNAQAGFAFVFLSQGNALLRAPIGLVGLVPMIAFAILLAATGRLKAQPDDITKPRIW